MAVKLKITSGNIAVTRDEQLESLPERMLNQCRA